MGDLRACLGSLQGAGLCIVGRPRDRPAEDATHARPPTRAYCPGTAPRVVQVLLTVSVHDPRRGGNHGDDWSRTYARSPGAPVARGGHNPRSMNSGAHQVRIDQARAADRSGGDRRGGAREAQLGVCRGRQPLNSRCARGPHRQHRAWRGREGASARRAACGGAPTASCAEPSPSVDRYPPHPRQAHRRRPPLLRVQPA